MPWGFSPWRSVTVVVSDTYPNYSVCGIPFYVSGEVPDWHQLAHRTAEEITREGVRLLESEAKRAGFDPFTVESRSWDHKAYYPGAHHLCIRVTGDRKTGRLLGAQMIGHYHGEVAKRMDIFATALFHGMSIDDLNSLDLSYTPPVSSPWDPIQTSAQAWVRAQGSSYDVVRAS